jgi:hypothetical protein
MMNNLLNELVLAQMRKDFESGDMTAIEELLNATPIENLVGYLPEQLVTEINEGKYGGWQAFR